MSSPDLQAFLAELTALSRKHGLVIGGCGCCESPWVDREELDACPNGSYQVEIGREDGSGEKLKWRAAPGDMLGG